MNKEEFLYKLQETKGNNTIINDKVFRDFIKFLIDSNQLNIDHKVLNRWNDLVIKTTKYNQRKFTTQSDLWALIYDEYFENEENLNIFKTALYNTMFKEQINYLNKNVEFKDEYSIKKENGNLSEIEIKHAKELLEWTVEYIQSLTNAKQTAIESSQINNLLTNDLSIEFFNEKHETFLKIFNWHKLGFEIIIK